MRLGLAQINTKVGALQENANKVQLFIEKAQKQNIDLLVFPELTITGYPPQDLLEHENFIERNMQTLDQLAVQTTGVAVILGFVDQNCIAAGKRLYNAAAFIEQQQIKTRAHKCLLPTYDVFDETRHFASGEQPQVVDFGGKRIGISICEDIWSEYQYHNFDPIACQVDTGVDYLVNISASPYEIDKWEQRAQLLRAKAQRYQKPIIYVNLVGGNDELIFDGRSMVISASGQLVGLAGDFSEELLAVEFPGSTVRNPISQSREENVTKALVTGIRDYTLKTGFHKVIIGLSGGIDSAVTATLATQALGAENVMGVAMPTRYSSPGSLQDAKKLAQNLNITYRVIAIETLFRAFLDTLSPIFHDMAEDITEENLQARIRGAILMALANKFRALVLTTGNKSEIAVGYCTLYGDTCGALAVISDLSKTFVYQLAEYLNNKGEIIPREIIEKAPSAELRPNQTDQDTLPDYDVLDAILQAYIEHKKGVDEIVAMNYPRELVVDVLRKVDLAEYKRKQLPPGLKITHKSFGIGRRMPLARGWF